MTERRSTLLRWRRALSEPALLLEALLAIAAASVAVRAVPFRRVAAWLGHPRAPRDPDGDGERAQIKRVRWAVNACAARVPWRAVCFQRGLAAHAMLRRRGVASTLHYGVGHSPDAGLKAHVWVTAGESEVVGVREAAGYTRLASFPRSD